MASGPVRGMSDQVWWSDLRRNVQNALGSDHPEVTDQVERLLEMAKCEGDLKSCGIKALLARCSVSYMDVC